MNLLQAIVHAVEHAAKKPLESVIKQLEDHRTDNLATITTIAVSGALPAQTAVLNFVLSAVKRNPTLAAALALFGAGIEAQAETYLGGLVASGANDIPKLYDGLVTFLKREDSFLP